MKRFALAIAALLLVAACLSGCDSPTLSSATETPDVVWETPGLPLVPDASQDIPGGALNPNILDEGDDEDAPSADELPPPLWTLEAGGAETGYMTSYDFAVLPHTTVDVDGATYSGVLLMDALSFLKLAPGTSYEITGVTQSVTLTAGDILSPDTLLADAKNGAPIDPPEGPLLLVTGTKFDLWLPGVVALKPAPDSVK